MAEAERVGVLRQISFPQLPWILIAGLVAIVAPTMFSVASETWTTEQGSGGPIIFALACWLAYRRFCEIGPGSTPGSAVLAIVLIIPVLMLYVLSIVTSTIEAEVLFMYLAVIIAGYSIVGASGLRSMWFPILFMLFSFPPPDTIFAMITQPLKIYISEWAVNLLFMFGLPIANSGVTIQVGQYQMLVAAACSGINSLISLTALGLFYSYMRRDTDYKQLIILVMCIVPIAIFVNFFRVVLLILITYQFGDAAGQGFFHNFAGLAMFGLALLLVFVVDSLLNYILPGRHDAPLAAAI